MIKVIELPHLRSVPKCARSQRACAVVLPVSKSLSLMVSCLSLWERLSNMRNFSLHFPFLHHISLFCLRLSSCTY